VKGSSLDSDDARHRYVEQWTASSDGWPKARQTTSLREFFARATDREAGDFLAHVRALVEDERRATEEARASSMEHQRLGDTPEANDEEPF
jgi:ethanolamine ammonia-lyase large subunit